MPGPALRFLHAGDFHLERPVQGLAEIPDHLRQLLIDAPYRAAERVFDTAIAEKLDFVLLAGDIVEPAAAGPRGLAFLRQQFDRLAAAAVPIYWVGGRCDKIDIWTELGLPDDVHLFPDGGITRVAHERGGQPVAEILGLSACQRGRIRAARFQPVRSELFSIAIAYGVAEAAVLAAQPINYWALGGEHTRRMLCTEPCVAHYPGTPQGRRPREAGPHGCTIVQVDETARVRTSFVPTDVVRWHRETIAIMSTTTRGELEHLLHDRVQALVGSGIGPELLVQWIVRGSGPLFSQLRRGRLAGEILGRLRSNHGDKRPGLWSAAFETQTDGHLPPTWYEQDTVLGEFLRSVRHLSESPDEQIPLERYLSERHFAGSMAAELERVDAAARAKLLQEVALLGVDLLTPEEFLS